MANPTGDADLAVSEPNGDWFDRRYFVAVGPDDCIKAFDANQDGFLDVAEFGAVCRALFREAYGKVHALEPEKVAEIFSVFDKNKDNFIDRNEFQHCWDNWINKILRPVSVFLVVDVQNDFISGALDVSTFPDKQQGAEVVAPINNLVETVGFDQVFYSLDWHPANHISFIDNVHLRPLDSTSKLSADNAKTYDTVVFKGPPLVEQRLWPRHCVQDTWGAELHSDLKIAENAIKVYKGTNPEIDSYSAFWDNNKLSATTLDSQIKQRNATDVYVCGLAYDVCVGATAADALTLGYRTILVDDCSRGVALKDVEKTKETFKSQGGVIVPSSQVAGMVHGSDRRAELGYKLALELKKSAVGN